MISIVEGVVGGGKTIYAVRQILSHVARGGRVWTNIDMQIPEVRNFVLAQNGKHYRHGQINFFPETDGVKDWWELVEWGDLSCPILCILDESQLFWNARNHRETAKEQERMLSFLTQSRKAGVDVMFITQDETTIDAQFRKQAETTILARNMAHHRIPYLGIRLKGWIHYSHFENKGGTRYKFEWWRLNRKVFACYKTEAFLDNLMVEMAKSRDRVSAVKLRSASPLRKIHASLEQGDAIEKKFAKKIRPLVAAHVINRRRKLLAA